MKKQTPFGNQKASCTIITLSGSITATEEAHCVRNLDMCITVQHLEDSQAVFSLRISVKNIVFFTNGRKDNHPHWPTMAKSPIVVRKMLYRSSCLELLLTRIPEAMQMEHRDTERRRLRETESKIFQTGFSHLRKDCRRRSWIIRQRWWTKSHNTSSTSETLEQIWRETQFTQSFSDGPQTWYFQAHRNHQSSMQKESRRSRRQDTTSYKFWEYSYSGSQSCQWRERIAIAPSICGSCTRFGFSMDTELSVQKQDSARYEEKFAAFLHSRAQPGVIYIDKFFRVHKSLRRAVVEYI